MSVPLAEESGPNNIIKPMLTTAQKNFKSVSHPASITNGDRHSAVSVVREDQQVPGSVVFLLHNLLTPLECQHYITETEGIGYSDLSATFPAGYRSNERVLSMCEPLVEELWRRVEPHLTRREVVRVRPVGFGNHGIWKPFRLNECCKFGKYSEGGHFSPHIDGPWVPRQDESSVFTVVLYLNSDFTGGATQFIHETNNSVLCSVEPKEGSALIFNHDTLHEAEPVGRGTKYMLRTEIMYQRVDTEMLPDAGDYETQGNYIRTLTLYQKSWELEQAGDIQGFQDTYLAAIQLQREAQSSIQSEPDPSLLPYELFLRVFSYLAPPDLCRIMTVCKLWYEVGRDGQLWYELYQRHWPLGLHLEGRVKPHPPHSLKILDERPFLRDWYELYRQRAELHKPEKVVVLDMGSHSFKCASLNRARGSVLKTSCRSVVANVPGIYDLHMRRYDYQRYYSGQEAIDRFEGKVDTLVQRGVVKNPAVLPEIITRLYMDCVVRPKRSPVIVLEPPGLWTDQMKRNIARPLIVLFAHPAVTFLRSDLATLCSMGLCSGVVVSMGAEVVTCGAVIDGRPCASSHTSPVELTPTRVADIIISVIDNSTDDAPCREVLGSHVILTGGAINLSVQVLQAELGKRSAAFNIKLADDVLYSGVLGGCSLASVSNFTDLNTQENFPKIPTTSRNSHFFYSPLLFWYRFLNSGKREYENEYTMINWMVLKLDNKFGDSMRDLKQRKCDEGLLDSDGELAEEEIF